MILPFCNSICCLCWQNVNPGLSVLLFDGVSLSQVSLLLPVRLCLGQWVLVTIGGFVSSVHGWWGFSKCNSRACSQLSTQQLWEPGGRKANPSTTCGFFQYDRLFLTIVADAKYCLSCQIHRISFLCFVTPDQWFQQGDNPGAIFVSLFEWSTVGTTE